MNSFPDFNRISSIKPNRLQRFVQRLAARQFNSRWLAVALPRLDRPLIRLSRGAFSLTTLLTSLPLVTLTTIGRRSGMPRRTLLVGIPFGEDIVLVASNFGGVHHPDWYFNLLANPQAQVEMNGCPCRCLARLAEGAEREALLQRAAALYPGYGDYVQRAAHREIGVFVLQLEGV